MNSRFTWFWLPLVFAATVSFAGTLVDQGKPGKAGAWPVFAFGPDGGGLVQGSGQDGGVWAVYDNRGPTLDSTIVAAGQTTGAIIENKFGRNADIDTGTVPEDLWNVGGVYTGFPLNADGGPTAETIQVFSASADDDSAGTGARSVKLEGLDINYAEITETVTLAGTTPVTTAQAFSRLNLVYVVSAGSGGVNAGIITGRHSTTTANVFFGMPVGYNQSQTGAYTVPAGKTAYIRNIGLSMAGGGSARLEVVLWTREGTLPVRLQRPYAMLDTTIIDDVILGGLKFNQKTDIIVRVLSSATLNVSLSGHLDMYVLDN